MKSTMLAAVALAHEIKLWATIVAMAVLVVVARVAVTLWRHLAMQILVVAVVVAH